jgi:hypothetical protein
MARDASAQLEALYTARDAITDGIAAGRLTVEYEIRGRKHVVTDPISALERLERTIAIYERKATNASKSPFRLGSLQRSRGSG